MAARQPRPEGPRQPRQDTWASRRAQATSTPQAASTVSEPHVGRLGQADDVPPDDPMSYYNSSSRKPEGYSPYTEEEQVMVTKARRTHEETTEHARRALQAAERTKEIGAGTLDELHRQGKRLEIIDRDLQEIDADVEESKSILRYMQRCCLCFLCASCCDCDPNKVRDETRKSRVKMRQNARRQEMAQMAEEDQLRRAGHANGNAPEMTEDEKRDELMEKPETARERLRKTRDQDSAARSGPQLGDGLAEADRVAIQDETRTQDEYLDKIEDALGHLKQMGVEMNEELEDQDHRITHLQIQTEGTVQNLTQVTTGATKNWGLNKK